MRHNKLENNVVKLITRDVLIFQCRPHNKLEYSKMKLTAKDVLTFQRGLHNTLDCNEMNVIVTIMQISQRPKY